MVMQGETVETGAPTKCSACGAELSPAVQMSAAGYYVGYWCWEDGPYTRESGYYPTREAAQAALDSGIYGR